mgnify:CR=1 FL=1|jgi:cysteine synthase
MSIRSYTVLCGNTPLIKINDSLYAKLETYSPSGSVKDRVVSYVVNKAIQDKAISSNTTLCEATSGNTGIALSAAAAALGLECVVFMPSNMSEERKQMMRIYGATIVESPPDDFEAAIKMRDEFLGRHVHAWSPMQFSNPANVECHEAVTAPEIHKNITDIGLTWSAFVHGAGTGGTIEGLRRYIIGRQMSTKVIMTQPSESPHGIQGIADGKEFLALDSDMSGIIKVDSAAAIERAKQFAKETGLLVGISSGANLLAAQRWIDENNPSGVVITMLCDRGERYMSIYGDDN